MTKYNYLDLFSGIGGFAYGAFLAGMKIKNHFYSEIDPYCVELYQKRFPDSIYLGDITKIDFEKLKRDYGENWIITGGFPCQDISIAGKGAGLDGERSGLWFEYWRAIRILRPRFAIIENVWMLTRRGLSTVLGNIAEVGYDAEWGNISASNIGACHKRERCWIIAYPQGKRLQEIEIQKENIGEGCCKKPEQWKQFLSINAGNYYLENWENFESEFCGDYDGLSGTMDRFKGLGNAIVPQIAQLLFERIKEYL